MNTKQIITVALAAVVGNVLGAGTVARKMSVTVSGYSGAAPLTGYPLLVKLGTGISDFSYQDFAYPASGADLRFATADGTVLPHEIDTWNPKGTSLVWVRVPALAAGTSITCYYGLPAGPVAEKSGVWSRYAAVYHLNSSGADSAAHALDAALGKINLYGTNTPLGTCKIDSGTYGWWDDHYTFKVPLFDGWLEAPSRVQYSGWFKFLPGTNVHSAMAVSRLFSRANNSGTTNQFDLRLTSGASPTLALAASNLQSPLTIPLPDGFMTNWTQVAVQFNGTAVALYTNGAQAAAGTLTAPLEASGVRLGVACVGGDAPGSFLVGSFDEPRVLNGAPGSDWVQADYRNVAANGSFLTYGSVSSSIPAVLATNAVESLTPTGAVVKAMVVSLPAGAATVYAIYGKASEAARVTNAVAVTAAGGISVTLTGLSPNTSYVCDWAITDASSGTVPGWGRYVFGTTLDGSTTWTGSGADSLWANGSNWDSGFPASVAVKAAFTNAAEVTLPAGAALAADLSVNGPDGDLAVSGGTLALNGRLNIGNKTGGARMTFLEGSALVPSNSIALYLGDGTSSNVLAVATNATLRLIRNAATGESTSYVGSGVGGGNQFNLLPGSSCTMDSMNLIIGNSWGSGLRIGGNVCYLDSASLTVGWSMTVGKEERTFGNELVLADNSCCTVNDKFHIGRNGSRGNWARVTDSTLKVRNGIFFPVGGGSNVLAITDGTVTSTTNFSAEPVAGGLVSDNNRLILSGAKPSLWVGADFSVTNGGLTVEYALPASGYAQAPVQVVRTAALTNVEWVVDASACIRAGTNFEGALLKAGTLALDRAPSVRLLPENSGLSATVTVSGGEVVLKLARGFSVELR